MFLCPVMSRCGCFSSLCDSYGFPSGHFVMFSNLFVVVPTGKCDFCFEKCRIKAFSWMLEVGIKTTDKFGLINCTKQPYFLFHNDTLDRYCRYYICIYLYIISKKHISWHVLFKIKKTTPFFNLHIELKSFKRHRIKVTKRYKWITCQNTIPSTYF